MVYREEARRLNIWTENETSGDEGLTQSSGAKAIGFDLHWDLIAVPATADNG